MGILAVANSVPRAMAVFPRGTRMLRERILIVEEKETRGVLHDYLENKGYEVATAGTCALTERIWRTAPPDIAILDYAVSDGNALALIPRLRAMNQSIPIIVLTGYGSIDLAVEAVKLGAELFLPKPVEMETLHILIKRNLEHRQERRQQLADKPRDNRGIADPFLGKSDCVRRLVDAVHKAALSDNPILIHGELGTGKKTIARWLHRNSPRASEPFVDLNCREVSGNILETKLFGDASPALVRASQKTALVEIAHKGTILLDEIENVDFHLHAKVLKLVEEKQFRRLGESFGRRVDIRLMASTQQTPGQFMSRKPFRGELSHNIPWTYIPTPPLRERLNDIPILSAQILSELATELGTGHRQLGPVALRALQSYTWPGNIRELRNVLERAVLLTGRNFSADQDFRLDAQIEQYLAGHNQSRTLEEMERDYIEQVLRIERGRVQSAARKLGIPRSSLYHKLKQYKTEQSGLRSAS
jgi:DNA-binding NtrC family response regulator